MTEDRTREEKSEEQALVAEVMRTEVMRKTLAFLKAHGLFTKSPAEFASLLEELWFSVYRWEECTIPEMNNVPVVGRGSRGPVGSSMSSWGRRRWARCRWATLKLKKKFFPVPTET